MDETREFDLNIERVLEHWTLAHAVRELIANALDEASLTSTAEPEITKDPDETWHVRDFGRGVRYEHLTQNENKEKLANPGKVVGKFGVGLKDALATFDRRGIRVRIMSRFGSITTVKQQKHGFDDITTLHAVIRPSDDPAMVGTDVALSGIRDAEIDEAKSLFRHYAGDEVLADTAYGLVLARSSKGAGRIYVNGLRVAEEANYLFSYDITSPTKALRAALNRERTNVGRTAYTDRVKAILLAASSETVANTLAEDLSGFAAGTWHDETQLVDVGVHACQVLNATGKVIFMTPDELSSDRDFVERAEDDGYRVVVVPLSIRLRLQGATDITGAPIVDLGQFKGLWNTSFSFSFIDPSKLTKAERAVFDQTDAIMNLRGGRPEQVKEILISKTMRVGATGFGEAPGVWEEAAGRIIIKRDQLRSLSQYAGTLLHEVVHAATRTADISAEFENALSDEIGDVVSNAFQT